MPTVTVPIPTLVDGISQRPPALRQLSEVERMDNALPVLASGIVKRPPSEHVARLFETGDDYRTFSHFIDAGRRGQFLAVTDGPDVRVFDIDGDEQTVNYGITYYPVFSRVLVGNNVTSESFKIVVPEASKSIQYVVRWEAASIDDSIEFFWERSPHKDFSSDVNQYLRITPEDDEDQYTGSFDWNTDHNGQYMRLRMEVTAADDDNPVDTTLTVEAGMALYSTAYIAQESHEDGALSALSYDDDTYICNSSIETGRVPWRYNQTPYFDADDYTLRVWPGQDTPRNAEYLLHTTGIRDVDGISDGLRVRNVSITGTWSSNSRTIFPAWSDGSDTSGDLALKDLDDTIGANNQVKDYLDIERKNNTGLLRRKESSGNVALTYPFTVERVSVPQSELTIIPRITPDYTANGLVVTDEGDTVSWGDLGPGEFEAFPVDGPNGFIGPVSGAPGVDTDNYYVQFRSTVGVDDLNEGYWEECATPLQSNALSAYTMPHTLRLEDDGTWTFRPVNWALREAGDDDSNPFPSFLGSTITSLFIHEGRLGFLSGNTVFLSEVGVFHNLFRTTAAELLDSDPIDVQAAVTSGDSAEVNFSQAFPFDSRLIIFADNSQHALAGGDVLSPATVALTRVSDFQAAAMPSPAVSGRNLYFLSQSGRNTGVVEYFRGNTGSGESLYDGDVLTRYAPTLIPQGEASLLTAPASDLVIVRTTGSPDSLYLNSVVWTGRERQQAAWCRWTFDGATIVNMRVFGEELFLLMLRENDGDDSLFIERVSLDPRTTDSHADFKVLLDRRVHNSHLSHFESVFEGGVGKTAIGLPWEPEDGETYVLVTGRATHSSGGGPYEVGEIVHESTEFAVSSLEHPYRSVVFTGDHWDNRRADYYIGVRYDMEVEMTRPSLRVSPERGQPAVPVIDERVTVDSYGVSYTDTGYLQLETTSGYAVTPSVYTVGTLGRPVDSSNPFPKLEGFLGGVIAANPVDTRIVLRNSSHLPCTVYQAAWVGNYSSQGII